MGSDGMGNPVGTTAPNADLERHRLDLGVCYAVSRRHLEFERREDFSPYAPNAPPPGTLAASMAGGVDGAGRGNRRRRRTISRFASFAPHARDPALRAGEGRVGGGEALGEDLRARVVVHHVEQVGGLENSAQWRRDGTP